jgi:hypothetical protein
MAAAIVALCRQSADQWECASERAYRRAHGYSWDDAAERLLTTLQAK